MVEAKKSAPLLVDIKVELFGQARIVVGAREVHLAVPERAGARDLAMALANVAPELVGPIIRDNFTNHSAVLGSPNTGFKPTALFSAGLVTFGFVW